LDEEIAMKNALRESLTAWRQYMAGMTGSRTYRALRWFAACGALGYILLLSFPQVLFAYEVSHGNIKVYSRQPIDRNIHAILDLVEGKLAASGVNDPAVEPRIFIVDSYALYAALGLYVGANSFAKGYSALPATNIFVNRSDLARDVVFRDAAVNNERRLSGVIAHEITHFLVRKKLGYLKNLTLPAWKQEGYSEYVAGGTLLDRETGVRMWKQNPTDDTGYR
jgi:hypothetical protein